MSRVYNVLTGAARPTVAAAPDAPDDGVWANEVEAPFVEIGGPGGPIFSAAPTTTAPAKPEPEPEPVPPPANYPRLAPTPATPAYLSVRFHDLPGTAKPGDAPDASLVAFHHPDHPVSAEYRTLRDEIRKQHPGAAPRVLLFLAGASESGTTTVLLNLAVTLAGEGKSRVLVVDADVTRAAVAARLALKPAPGVCEVLSQHAPLAWAVQPTAVPNLQALTAGDATDTAAFGRDLPKLLGQLRQWYDWVVVDGGVWGQMTDRDAACPAADAVYLVTREGAAERPEFAGLRARVKEQGGALRGYIATRV